MGDGVQGPTGPPGKEDNRVPKDHPAVEGPSTPGGGRVLVQK